MLSAERGGKNWRFAMTKEEFKDKFRDGLDKFLKSSKEAFGKAGSAVQDFSDKSVIRIEKKQFESKRNGRYEELGRMIAEKLIEDPKAKVDTEGAEVVRIIEDVKKLNAEIRQRSDALASSSDETAESSGQ